MICLIVHQDRSIGAVIHCEPADRHRLNDTLPKGAHITEIDILKLNASALPSGIDMDTLYKLADLGYYLTETDQQYIFQEHQ